MTDDEVAGLALSSSNLLIEGLVALLIIIVPLWLVLHYWAKFRGSRQLNGMEAQALGQLSQSAARMEQRMAVLERILDAEVPDWRQSHDAGVRHNESL